MLLGEGKRGGLSITILKEPLTSYSTSGNSKAMFPSGGFNDSALAEIFGKTVQKYIPPKTYTTNSAPKATYNGNSETNRKSSSSSANHVGAIVGGVIGGVAAFAIFALLAFACLRRRRRRSVVQPSSSPFAMSTFTGNPKVSSLHEVHGVHRPLEKDGNGITEIGFERQVPELHGACSNI